MITDFKIWLERRKKQAAGGSGGAAVAGSSGGASGGAMGGSGAGGGMGGSDGGMNGGDTGGDTGGNNGGTSTSDVANFSRPFGVFVAGYPWWNKKRCKYGEIQTGPNKGQCREKPKRKHTMKEEPTTLSMSNPDDPEFNGLLRSKKYRPVRSISKKAVSPPFDADGYPPPRGASG